jgi:biopolymer transport protein ExbD
MRIPRPHRRKPRIELVPMIDTMFFIVVFFVVASVSMVHLRGIRVDLPCAFVGVRPEAARVTVTVQEDGSVFLAKEPIAIDALAPRLAQLLASDPDRPILINADRRARHGDVVAVMDAARRAGARSLSIAARPERTEAP